MTKGALMKPHATEQSLRTKRTLGLFADQVTITEDFNDTPPEILAALEEPLGKQS
jgi:hypothetical protein